MKPDATEAQVKEVLEVIRSLGFRPHPMPGATRTAIGITGNPGAIDPAHFEMLSGVAEAIRVSKPYKLVGRDLKHDDTVVRVGDVEIGGPEPAIIAGPCAVESREQTMAIAELVASAGVKLFRGGAFKPRTSPYSFQGLGAEGLKILRDAGDRFGLQIVTEVLDTETADIVEEYADVMQVGARNMQNFSLLRKLACVSKPVLLKRGPSATVKEWLLAAEYLLAGGNANVVLCERGIKTFETATRNTLDLAAVALVKELSHLPVLADPSHGTGLRSLITPMSKAAAAVGADGLLIEVHPCPERALSDGPQSLDLPGFQELMDSLKPQIYADEHRSKRAA
jgi:3-deoxy-7-phosphoheptulonate synthase